MFRIKDTLTIFIFTILNIKNDNLKYFKIFPNCAWISSDFNFKLTHLNQFPLANSLKLNLLVLTKC